MSKNYQWPTQGEVRKFFGEPGAPACTAGKVKLSAEVFLLKAINGYAPFQSFTPL